MHKMRTVTIIGLGWLGLPLAHFLNQRGWQVRGSKRTLSQQAELAEQGIMLYPFDIKMDFIPEALFESKAMVITIPPDRTDLVGYQQGITRLVEQAILQNVQQIIFLSSTSVLPQCSGYFDENSITQPANAVAQTLISLEQWLRHLPIHIDILRLAGLVGKQRHPVYYLAGKSQLNHANQPINLVHLQDCLRAIYLLLSQPNGQRLFHLCALNHPTRSDYYRKIAQQLGLADLHFLPDNTPLERIIVADKIERELGFDYHYPDPYLMI